MRYAIFERSVQNILNQRNMLFPICIILGITQVLSLVVIVFKNERIVIVPATVEKSFWVENRDVSPTYLEQMGMFLGMLMLNKSASSALYQRDIVLRHTVPAYYGDMKRALMEEEDKMKKDQSCYQFLPVGVQVDQAKRMVILTGDRVSYIGTQVVDTVREEYQLEFLVQAGRALLKSFTKVTQ